MQTIKIFFRGGVTYQKYGTKGVCRDLGVLAGSISPPVRNTCALIVFGSKEILLIICIHDCNRCHSAMADLKR